MDLTKFLILFKYVWCHFANFRTRGLESAKRQPICFRTKMIRFTHKETFTWSIKDKEG